MQLPCIIFLLFAYVASLGEGHSFFTSHEICSKAWSEKEVIQRVTSVNAQNVYLEAFDNFNRVNYELDGDWFYFYDETLKTRFLRLNATSHNRRKNVGGEGITQVVTNSVHIFGVSDLEVILHGDLVTAFFLLLDVNILEAELPMISQGRWHLEELDILEDAPFFQFQWWMKVEPFAKSLYNQHVYDLLQILGLDYDTQKHALKMGHLI